MCVVFKDHNLACPNNPYVLPYITSFMEDLSQNKIMIFMDAYYRYNQMKMNHLEVPKTAPMSNKCNYYYEVKTFGLKNASDIKQRLIDAVF